MRFQAVVFDLFGTLIDNFAIADYRAVIHRMADALEAPADDFTDGWLAGVNDRITGLRHSPAEDIAAICTAIGTKPAAAAVERAVQIRYDYSREVLGTRPETVVTLGRIRDLGFKTVLVSDCTWEIPALWDSSKLATQFDAVVFSCSEGTRKPDPQMYRLACERIGAEPGDCLYVGDGASTELSGAAEVGMHPVQILMPHEAKGYFGRNEAEEWDGKVITDLSQLIEILQA